MGVSTRTYKKADGSTGTRLVGENGSSQDVGGVLLFDSSGNVLLGQATMAASLPVAIASNQTAVPVSGTFWQATQPVSAASLPLPSGAATAAKQPALGTAGAPSADVLTVQGVSGGTALPTLEQSRAAAAANVHAPASNTAAIVTYAAAGAGVSNVIGGIAWSYNATPTSGNLKIEDGSGTTVFSVDITAAGPGFIPFARPLKGTANTALIVTLAAGGSGVTGKVSVLSKWTE